jgi:uncharacterized protein (DUF2461 family)
MDTKLIYRFLQDLQQNNSLDWMKSNKKYYEQAKAEYESLIQELIAHISVFDHSVVDLLPKDRTNRVLKLAQLFDFIRKEIYNTKHGNKFGCR